MYVITDCRINASALSHLQELGFTPILMPAAEYLQIGVASHTDMLIFLGFDKLFCHKKYYERNREPIDRISSISGNEILLTDEPTGDKYPLDVLFNACLVGDKLICNEKTVSKLLINTAKNLKCDIINVPQGYTKCSVCVVSENAVITADKAVAEACKAAKIDVLTVSEGYISLPPYKFGFIGGACGLCGDKIYFCGSVDTHPDGERIKRFCKYHNKTAVSLSGGELQDVGSLFFIN